LFAKLEYNSSKCSTNITANTSNHKNMNIHTVPCQYVTGASRLAHTPALGHLQTLCICH